MPGLHKMNHAGLHFLLKLYENNPSMPFSQMLPIYNKEAKARGWVCLRSSGTIGYHLTTMGLYQRGTRTPQPDPKRGLEIIELSTANRKALMTMFGVSSAHLSLILRHKRNGNKAEGIRNMALKLGGTLYVKAVIANDVLTL